MQCNDVHVDLDQTWIFLCDCSLSLTNYHQIAQRSWTAHHTREASIPYHASRFPLPRGSLKIQGSMELTQDLLRPHPYTVWTQCIGRSCCVLIIESHCINKASHILPLQQVLHITNMYECKGMPLSQNPAHLCKAAYLSLRFTLKLDNSQLDKLAHCCIIFHLVRARTYNETTLSATATWGATFRVHKLCSPLCSPACRSRAAPLPQLWAAPRGVGKDCAQHTASSMEPIPVVTT